MPSRLCSMDESNSAADPTDAESATIIDPAVDVSRNYKQLALTGTDCAVCTDHAPPGTSYRRHYGVICCEACKCFFRRTVQMNRDYKCRSEGSCYVGRTTENQKQVCQACRFQQCIRAGMKLESVKRFPRKARNGTEPGTGRDESKGTSLNKTTKKGGVSKTKRAKTNGQTPIKIGLSPEGNGVEQEDEGGAEVVRILAARRSAGDELQLCDTDLENVRFKMSPSEAMMYLQSASTSVPQLFKYDTLDTPPQEKPAPSLSQRPGSNAGTGTGLGTGLARSVSVLASTGTTGGDSTLPHATSTSTDAQTPPTSTGVATAQAPPTSTGVATAQAPLTSTRVAVAQAPPTNTGVATRPTPSQATPASTTTVTVARSALSQAPPTSMAVATRFTLSQATPTAGGAARLILSKATPTSTGATTRLILSQATPMNMVTASKLTLTPPPPGASNHAPSEVTGAEGSKVYKIMQGKRGVAVEQEELGGSKRVCLEGVAGGSGGLRIVQYSNSPSQISSPPSTPLTPLTPPHPHSSRPHSPAHNPDVEQLLVSSSSNNNNMAATAYSNTSPYITPHCTPTHTPHQSPLSSPTHMPRPSGYHGGETRPLPVAVSNVSSMVTLKTTPPSSSSSSSATMGQLNLSQLHLPTPATANPAIIFNSQSSHVPFRVLSSTPLLPMVLSTPPQHHHHHHHHHLLSQPTKSPFRIIPIPSINKTQPEELPNEPDVNVCDSPGDPVPGSAPPSGHASPVHTKPNKFNNLAEAQLEEVLDSLRLRIRSLFKWAKSEVSGFDDLSPLDQKALLRRTVPELVMLGFARGSIAYDDVLLLGSTGKVIRPTNQNSGVASVASVTLQKLVVPLKVLNISDRELTLLKEVVLFNPESNGLRNRELVRQNRKNKHLKLMEYTEKVSDDPGRFGELMCLLTPLFEVSTEVTEQLRLEQFVHEGEARIDALLLMSMIRGADEITDENTLDSQQLL